MHIFKNQCILLMEYAAGGELWKHVKEMENGISEIEARNIIKQILNAIEQCHNKGIVHRDLKLENVLFETIAKQKIKIVDFGISGRCRGGVGEKNDAGTYKYLPPEFYDNHSTASPSLDIWSIGVMLYLMLFKKFPFDGEDFQTKI